MKAFEKMGDVRLNCFVMSQPSLNDHVMIKSKQILRQRYYVLLNYFVSNCSEFTEYSNARLAQYRFALVDFNIEPVITNQNINFFIKKFLHNYLLPWRTKTLYSLFCDIAFILFERGPILKATRLLSVYLSSTQTRLIEGLSNTLFNNNPIPILYSHVKDLITQFRINRSFGDRNIKRIFVTANMSAGKSTLINAFIGKPVTRTSQGACTSNLCYLYNKPFEDNRIHLSNSSLNLSASYHDLIRDKTNEIIHIATYFRGLTESQERVCLVDTPGVNSAINQEHGKLSKKALLEENYDRLIYVLNANQLATEDESNYLKFVANNIQKEKVIFVLNKLDDFNKINDSIEASIEGVFNDLRKYGFERPIICPISAYFSLLIKMKKYGEPMTDDEIDDYHFFAKKFSRPEYNLSRFYGKFMGFAKDEITHFAVKCGFHGLENVITWSLSEDEKYFY